MSPEPDDDVETEDDPLDRLRCEYYALSGHTLQDALVLGWRFDEIDGYRDWDGESWVLAGDQPVLGLPTCITRVWCSPSGACFASGGQTGQVLYHTQPTQISPSQPVQSMQVVRGVSLEGVFGLADDSVYAWGSSTQGPRLFHFNGKRWMEMRHPGFDLLDLHGTSRSCLFAVGDRGALARFDGAAWHTFPTPTPEPLVCVFAVSDDEAYAVGGWGSVLEGSLHGWAKIGEGPRWPTGRPGPLRCVAKWEGELWVGAGVSGLWRRKGKTHELEQVADHVLARWFDARGELLIASQWSWFATKDGKAFQEAGQFALAGERDGLPLMDGMLPPRRP